MPPALWGSLTAVCWGSADFLSRYTGGRLGVATALAGMMFASLLLLVAYAWQSGMPLLFPAAGWLALLGTCVGIVVGTLLLYWGMVRGPVSLVAPIVAAYPVWSLAIALAEGVTPSFLQWAAMLAVMAGVVVVARLGGDADETAKGRPGGIPATVVIALLGSFAFASGIACMQTAGPLFGELQVLIAIRLFGVVVTGLALVIVPGLYRPVPWRWWPALAVQGLLDGVAYLSLLVGSRDPALAPTAVVAASTFCIVPVVLAWIVLRERIVLAQWLAVLVVVLGVAVLSAS